MANPKRKIVKKVASFIKSRANSTDNMTRGPIDKSINKVNMRAGRRMKPTQQEGYHYAPKSTVRERALEKKQWYEEIYKGMPSDMDDIPF